LLDRTTCLHTPCTTFGVQPGRKGSEDRPSDQRRRVHVDAEASVDPEPDLDQVVKESIQNCMEVTATVRTASILIISSPGRHINISSRISAGTPVKQNIDTDMVLESAGVKPTRVQFRGPCRLESSLDSRGGEGEDGGSWSMTSEQTPNHQEFSK